MKNIAQNIQRTGKEPQYDHTKENRNYIHKTGQLKTKGETNLVDQNQNWRENATKTGSKDTEDLENSKPGQKETLEHLAIWFIYP